MGKQGCYVVAGSSANSNMRSFVWYFFPQYHFINAWSNILGFTSLPGNSFSFAEALYSPEYLSQLALSNYKGGKGYDPSNTNGTSLFPQGSTIVSAMQYDYDYTTTYVEYASNCPSGNVSNLCDDFAQCHSPLQGYPSSESPSVYDCIGFMMVLVVGYSLLAGYVIAVHPMDNGAAMKFYNPLNIHCYRHKRSTNNGEDGVVATNVSKSYGKVDALKPFSLTMKTSEVTALLGHNGAGRYPNTSFFVLFKPCFLALTVFDNNDTGKSTFVNLLCCAQNPSKGDIRIGELSIISDRQAIQKIIGECKQDDFLWPNLSAREHLELYAGIRGVSAKDMADIVQRWLDSVDLDDVQHIRVSAYSGGMKRRLSVANSTIGETRIVVLDEPTTGKWDCK
jgi:ABC-type Na+ transport system ATPase subunit NatA